MEKKFIYKSDLGEILEDIAEKAVELSDRMSTYVIFRDREMGIHTVQCDIPCKTLSRVEYTIVDDVDNSLDVLDDIFGDALVALEELTIIKNNVEGTDHQ